MEGGKQVFHQVLLSSQGLGVKAEGISLQVVSSELEMRLGIRLGGEVWRANISILSTAFWQALLVASQECLL